MNQTKLDRLKARGSVVIDADADGYSVSWWPKGQKGNPLCGRGESGPVLEPLIVRLEEATRPPLRDWEYARAAREWQEEWDWEQRQRAALRGYDLADRHRERWARQLEESRLRRDKRQRAAERDRVRRVLTS